MVVTGLLLAGGYAFLATSGNDCPSYLSVSPGTPEADDSVVAFENLSAQRQETFRDALDTGSVEIESTDGKWVELEFVRYEGESYLVVVSVC